ncbi:signal peptidase I [Schlesneria sp. T3-172]|uniref:signal peptidase I n=1 Tax=Schlesneria sphaerica TaxID=3373610 RepID=UPI0037CA6A22
MTELPSNLPNDERRDSNSPHIEQDNRGTFRALLEAFVSLFIAVLLFRTFAAEGYMISTGSMAPCLLGYHKRVVCPTCKTTFPFGTAYDTDDDPEANRVMTSRSRAVCPNCGQPGIDVSDVPRNHGDQLLVNKQAYLYQQPHRWDVIVFRNPARPTEAYVKRLVGLPGERIQIIAGDVYVNDEIARKTYQQQLATRILVHDHSHLPADDDGFHPHWEAAISTVEPDERSHAGWEALGTGFQMKGGHVRRPDKEPIDWVEYHHWVRSGGLHNTSVHLEQWPTDVNTASVPPSGLRFDPRSGEFSVTGTLSASTARELLDLSDDEAFRNAVLDLYQASHVVSVSDSYGYNPVDEVGAPNPVRDLMVSAQVTIEGGSGEFFVEITNGVMIYHVVFDIVHREVLLYEEPLQQGVPLNSEPTGTEWQSEAVAVAPWPKSMSKSGGKIEVSLIDKQVLIAVDGQVVMPPWQFDYPVSVPPSRIPLRVGARGLDVKIDQLKLYRDVYYTDTRSRHAINRPYQLKKDEFFVLGDNSPVSHDSRRWNSPVVNQTHLIGKPFLVHLPSKPGSLRMGNRELQLRIPDWERIRFLR